jgi:F-type H+-transporting ATPase subunit epsilon
MQLKVLVPSGVFADLRGVSRIVATSAAGSFALLPRRLDCVAVLVPGIFTYAVGADGVAAATGAADVYLAVDEGVLVKTGDDVLVSVRRAIAGATLTELRAAVTREFLTLDADERAARAAMRQLESGFIGRFAEFDHAR